MTHGEGIQREGAIASFHLASLLDLSARITEADPIDILNVAVLSIMGRLRVQRACVLVQTGRHYTAEARLCKGVPQFSIPFMDLDGISHVEEGTHAHAPFIQHGLQLIVPLRHSMGIAGILCLGPRLGGVYDDDVTTYLELARNIIGTTVHNAQMVGTLVQAKKELEARNLMVTTLFESARDFTGAKTRDELLRIMSYRLMGQLMVSTFALYMREPVDDPLVIVSRSSASALADAYDVVIHIEEPCIVDDLDEGDPLRRALADTDIGMIAPMTVHGVTKGVVATTRKLNGHPFATEELSFLEAIGNTAMTALENERLIQEEMIKLRLEGELEIAADIQRGLLPTELPFLEGLEVAARAETSRMIGGDYYDVIPLDNDRTLFAIADVAGKGVPAALLMANVQAALNVLARSNLPLTQLASQINDLVCANTEPEVFITMFLCVVNTKTMGIEYVNAGHNPPILLQGNDVVTLTTGGILTGVISDPPPYDLGVGSLKKGDLLVLYTDGVTEARQGTTEWGVGSLVELLRQLRLRPVNEIVDEVQQAVLDFAENHQYEDDTSLLVIRLTQH